MATGDFGRFGLLWILTNLFFLMALIVGAFMLTKWLVRRAKTRQQHPHQLSENNSVSAQINKMQAHPDPDETEPHQQRQQVGNLK